MDGDSWHRDSHDYSDDDSSPTPEPKDFDPPPPYNGATRAVAAARQIQNRLPPLPPSPGRGKSAAASSLSMTSGRGTRSALEGFLFESSEDGVLNDSLIGENDEELNRIIQDATGSGSGSVTTDDAAYDRQPSHKKHPPPSPFSAMPSSFLSSSTDGGEASIFRRYATTTGPPKTTKKPPMHTSQLRRQSRNQNQGSSPSSSSSSSSSMENTSGYLPMKEVRLDNDEDTAFEDPARSQVLQSKPSMAETTLEGSEIAPETSPTNGHRTTPASATARESGFDTANGLVSSVRTTLDTTATLKKEMARSNARVRKLEGVNKALTAQHRDEIRQYEAQIAELMAERDKNANAAKQLSKVEKDAKKKSESFMAYKIKVENSQKRAAREAAELHRKLSETQATNEELKAALDQISVEKQSAEEKNESLIVELERLRHGMQGTDDDKEQLRYEIEENQRTIEQVSHDNQKLEHAFQARSAELNDLQNCLSETQSELKDAQQTIDDLNGKLREATGKVRSLEGELSTRRTPSRSGRGARRRSSPTPASKEAPTVDAPKDVDIYGTKSMEESAFAERIARANKNRELITLAETHQRAMRTLEIRHDDEMKRLKAKHEEQIRNMTIDAEKYLDQKLHEQLVQLKEEHREMLQRTVSKLSEEKKDAEASARERMSLAQEELMSRGQQLQTAEGKLRAEESRRILAEKTIVQMKRDHATEKMQLERSHVAQLSKVQQEWEAAKQSEMDDIKNGVLNMFTRGGGGNQGGDVFGRGFPPSRTAASGSAAAPHSGRSFRSSPNSIASNGPFFSKPLNVETSASPYNDAAMISEHSRSSRSRLDEITAMTAEMKKDMENDNWDRF